MWLEMMEFQSNVLCTSCEFLHSCHFDARLIIFMHLALELGCGCVHWEDSVQLFDKIHEWNYFSQCFQESNVLSLCCVQCNFSLQFAYPENWAVCLDDNKHSPWYDIFGIFRIWLRPSARKVGIFITSKPFWYIGLKDYASIASMDQISAQAHDCLFMAVHGLVTETSSLVHCHCYFRAWICLQIM